MSDKEFDHHLITLAAFRYALGRTTYIVGEMVDWIISHWSAIPTETKELIIRETEQAVEFGCAGDECDVQDWQRLLDFAHEKSRF